MALRSAVNAQLRMGRDELALCWVEWVKSARRRGGGSRLKLLTMENVWRACGIYDAAGSAVGGLWEDVNIV